MITEDYVSYEVAKLLKEKGFPMIEHLFMYVNKDNVFMTDHHACLKLSWEEYKNFDEVYTPTITHQIAMKWLREVHKIWFLIYRDFIKGKWDYGVYHNDYGEEINSGDEHYFDTYEEAVEAALKYCLTELI